MKNQTQSIVESVLEMRKNIRVDVKIPHDEVDRIVVNRLIGIRNFEGNQNKDMTYIDKTIKFFLTEDEFQKYAIEKNEIEY
ncbi:MAG: hypothetical protein GY750_12335 [Lentisphaerae bacterium]|nr:hypothetical protein [Lentisphaerota bacterium]